MVADIFAWRWPPNYISAATALDFQLCTWFSVALIECVSLTPDAWELTPGLGIGTMAEQLQKP